LNNFPNRISDKSQEERHAQPHRAPIRFLIDRAVDIQDLTVASWIVLQRAGHALVDLLNSAIVRLQRELHFVAHYVLAFAEPGDIDWNG
jgi:hypothetical protein